MALQSLDVLHTYRGLVESGKIRSDENQIRVVMQVRAWLTRGAGTDLVTAMFSSGNFIEN